MPVIVATSVLRVIGLVNSLTVGYFAPSTAATSDNTRDVAARLQGGQ